MIEKYRDFYDYLIFTREVRESSATYNIQKIHTVFKYTSDFSAESIKKVFINLKQEGRSNNYLNSIRDVVRLYAYFLESKGVKVDPYIYSIKKLKEEPVMRTTLNDSEIEAFLKLPCPLKGEQYKHNYDVWTLFFEILAYTGMRPQEVATLTVDQVDFGRKVFILPVTKTFPRMVPIPPNIEHCVQNHVSNCDKYLFPSKQGGNSRFGIGVFSNTQWGYNFKIRLDRLGIKRKGLCVYSLRHSLITRLLEEDVNLFKVQKIVGHRRVDTTARYTHMTTKDMHTALAKHPLIRRATDPRQILDAFKEVVRSFEFDKNEKFSFKLLGDNKELTLYLSFK
jgi:integrase